jgi:hypothetical protein
MAASYGMEAGIFKVLAEFVQRIQKVQDKKM